MLTVIEEFPVPSILLARGALDTKIVIESLETINKDYQKSDLYFTASRFFKRFRVLYIVSFI